MLNENEVVLEFFKIQKQSRPKVGVAAFRQRYLPLLADFFSGRPVDMTPWLEVCHRPSISVDVVNPDASVAFVVPPLFVPSGISRNKDLRLTASELLTQLERKLLVNPAGADTFMQQVAKVLTPTLEMANQHRQLWQAIFDDCGISVNVLGQKGSNPSGPLKDYEFEDI